MKGGPFMATPMKPLSKTLQVNDLTLHYLEWGEAAAPPIAWIVSETIDHSACQPPKPRSCSCTMLERNPATRPGRRLAAARATAHPTGFRL